MSEMIRVLGGLLLVAAGTGGGIAVYSRKYHQWRQLHTFARLLAYLRELLAYQPLNGGELLARAARYPAFARLGVGECGTLAALPLPGSLPPGTRQELQQGLEQLAFEPRSNACATLKRLETLCEDAAVSKREESQAARRLWPRLGACAGMLAAILLW